MKKFMIAIVVLLVILVGAGLYGYKQVNDVSTLNNQDFEYVIEKGKSSNGVISDLAAKGVVKDEKLFKIHAKINKLELNFKAGTYVIKSKTSAKDLVSLFNAGVLETNFVTLTILNGWTTDKAVDEINKVTGLTKEDLLDYMYANKGEYWFTADLDSTDRILDGILYPDTYQLSQNANSAEVMKKLLSNMSKKLEPYKEQLLASEYSMLELFTLASMIEKEALHDEDRPKIAQIIYNRLEINMLLQIDATVLAAVGWKNTVTYEDLKVDSPYNTYKYKGLPPTPIAMPSVTSITATVNPEKHDYIYYVADRKTGYHHYAKTFKEHEDNIKKYWKINE